MPLKICQLLAILLSAIVAGMFFGPWLALSRSIAVFQPEVFITIVRRMNRNMAAVMTALMPTCLLSIAVLLVLTYHARRGTFYLNLAAFALFLVALLVTVLVEVPIVTQVETWTAATLPENWQQLRDRWGKFHVVRIVAAVVGLGLIVIGAVF